MLIGLHSKFPKVRCHMLQPRCFCVPLRRHTLSHFLKWLECTKQGAYQRDWKFRIYMHTPWQLFQYLSKQNGNHLPKLVGLSESQFFQAVVSTPTQPDLRGLNRMRIRRFQPNRFPETLFFTIIEATHGRRLLLASQVAFLCHHYSQISGLDTHGVRMFSRLTLLMAAARWWVRTCTLVWGGSGDAEYCYGGSRISLVARRELRLL